MQLPDPSHTLLLEQGVEGVVNARAHWEVPLQVLVVQASGVHVMAVPTQDPAPLQWSPYVHAWPSSQLVVVP